VPCRISENIEGDLWTKLVWNSALNAVSALGGARNMAKSASSAMLGKLSKKAVYEVLAVARAAGFIPRTGDPQAALAGALKIATQMAEALFSTGKDLNRGRDGD